MCRVGKFLNIWKENKTDACPRWEQKEDASHAWTCQDISNQDIWNTKLGYLENWLVKKQTNPNITQAIIAGLSAWRSESNIALPRTNTIPELYRKQEEAGLGIFFKAFTWQIGRTNRTVIIRKLGLKDQDYFGTQAWSANFGRLQKPAMMPCIKWPILKQLLRCSPLTNAINNYMTILNEPPGNWTST